MGPDRPTYFLSLLGNNSVTYLEATEFDPEKQGVTLIFHVIVLNIFEGHDLYVKTWNQGGDKLPALTIFPMLRDRKTA